MVMALVSTCCRPSRSRWSRWWRDGEIVEDLGVRPAYVVKRVRIAAELVW